MNFDQPDGLSALLQRLQLHAEVYVNGEFCGPWAVDTSGAKHMPFHLISRGEAWLHMGSEPPRHLTSGDLVFFPHDDRHIIASDSLCPAEEAINVDSQLNMGPITQMVCGFFEFKNKQAWPLVEALGSVVILDLSAMSDAPQVRTVLDLMIGELSREQPGHYAVVNHLAYLLFVEVIRQQIKVGAIQSGLLTALFDTRISRALAAIHGQPGRHWSLELLAAETAMGRSSFAKRFNDMVGMPAMQYLVHWRMQEATHELVKTQRTITDIAEQCGYESEAAFRKAFKKVTGRTPSDVRKAR
ncbi:AraC family transcriptional regulator [Marinagarivorans algicola]|uniref:AraC family transcriptional regulator n=1 Tax=Marinagarivorans algicola TaxID=1513270 RepID=UPI0006B4C5B8|nr:AraC family transcriptional regulator [Marinagarivorans algicola]